MGAQGEMQTGRCCYVDYIEKCGDGAIGCHDWRGSVGRKARAINGRTLVMVKKILFHLRPVKFAAEGRKKRL